ncbi:hypothetical protein LCGC14_1866020, partial [marine sediment metagenome]
GLYSLEELGLEDNRFLDSYGNRDYLEKDLARGLDYTSYRLRGTPSEVTKTPTFPLPH